MNAYTMIPNDVFDELLIELTGSELKIFLVILRQTLGWKNQRTGKRKIWDRINQYQFKQKTGLSKRVISQSIQSLVDKKLIRITNYEGNILDTPLKRRGNPHLFYSLGERLMQK